MRVLLTLLTGAVLVAASAPSAPRMSTVRSADGVELLVAETGERDRPGILFIHGFGQSHLSFRRQFASALAQRFHLVAFDLRGHGGSAKPDDAAAYADPARYADDVAAVIAATRLERPVLVGWSYGGLVVSDYVRKHGTTGIAGVVLIGSLAGLSAVTAPPPPPALAEVAAAMRSASELTRALDLASNIEGSRLISDAYATPAMAEPDRRLFFATEMMLPAYVRRRMITRRIANSDLVARFAALPMLLVRGERELGMPEAAIADLSPRLPRMTVSRYDDVGHLVFLEAPDRFNAELTRFVALARGDATAALPRPGFPMTLAAHRAFRDREFSATDRDHDGRLDRADLRARMEAALGTSSPDGLARAMRVNCGRELPACPRAAFQAQGDAEFARVDGNHDGVVTQAEFAAAGASFHQEQPY